MERKPPKLATMPRISHRACTCCICPYGYPWWVVELIRHRRTVIPAFISPVIPHTGVRQHDAPGNSAPSVSVVLPAQTRLSWPSALTSAPPPSGRSAPAPGPLRIARHKFTASRKRHTPGGGPPWPPPGSASSAIPVTRPNRLDTVSDGRALLPFRFISKPLPSIGYA